MLSKSARLSFMIIIIFSGITSGSCCLSAGSPSVFSAIFFTASTEYPSGSSTKTNRNSLAKVYTSPLFWYSLFTFHNETFSCFMIKGRNPTAIATTNTAKKANRTIKFFLLFFPNSSLWNFRINWANTIEYVNGMPSIRGILNSYSPATSAAVPIPVISNRKKASPLNSITKKLINASKIRSQQNTAEAVFIFRKSRINIPRIT